MVEQVEFKDFKIGELFENPQRGTRLISQNRIPGETVLITAGKENYGESAKIFSTTQQLFCGENITIDMFGNVFFRDCDFFADDNIIVLNGENYSKKSLIYLTSVLSKSISGKYSYSKQFRMKELPKTTISLPVTSSGTPDYSYMESYISYIEKLHVANIEKLLQELGYNSLKDVELTQEDKEILSLFSGGEKLTLAEFKIGELFEIYLSKGDNKISHLEKGNVPLVSSGVSDNGIVGHVKIGDKDAQLFSKNSMTVDMFGNCFTQVQDFYAVSHGRVNILNLKNNSSSKTLLYVCSVLNKSTQNSIYGFSNMLSSRKLANLKIPLPINPQSPTTPNYSLMESYITAIEKLHVNKLISSHSQEITALNTVI